MHCHRHVGDGVPSSSSSSSLDHQTNLTQQHGTIETQSSIHAKGCIELESDMLSDEAVENCRLEQKKVVFQRCNLENSPSLLPQHELGIKCLQEEKSKPQSQDDLKESSLTSTDHHNNTAEQHENITSRSSFQGNVCKEDILSDEELKSKSEGEQTELECQNQQDVIKSKSWDDFKESPLISSGQQNNTQQHGSLETPLSIQEYGCTPNVLSDDCTSEPQQKCELENCPQPTQHEIESQDLKDVISETKPQEEVENKNSTQINEIDKQKSNSLVSHQQHGTIETQSSIHANGCIELESDMLSDEAVENCRLEQKKVVFQRCNLENSPSLLPQHELGIKCLQEEKSKPQSQDDLEESSLTSTDHHNNTAEQHENITSRSSFQGNVCKEDILSDEELKSKSEGEQIELECQNQQDVIKSKSWDDFKESPSISSGQQNNTQQHGSLETPLSIQEYGCTPNVLSDDCTSEPQQKCELENCPQPTQHEIESQDLKDVISETKPQEEVENKNSTQINEIDEQKSNSLLSHQQHGTIETQSSIHENGCIELESDMLSDEAVENCRLEQKKVVFQRCNLENSPSLLPQHELGIKCLQEEKSKPQSQDDLKESSLTSTDHHNNTAEQHENITSRSSFQGNVCKEDILSDEELKSKSVGEQIELECQNQQDVIKSKSWDDFKESPSISSGQQNNTQQHGSLETPLSIQEYGCTPNVLSDDCTSEPQQKCELENCSQPTQHEIESQDLKDVISETKPQEEVENKNSTQINEIDEQKSNSLVSHQETSGCQANKQIQGEENGNSQDLMKGNNTMSPIVQRQATEENKLLSSQISYQQTQGDSSQKQSLAMQTESKSNPSHSSHHTTKEQNDLSLDPEEGNQLENVNDEEPRYNLEDDDPSLFNQVDQRTLRLHKINDTTNCKVMHRILTWGTKDKDPGMGFDEYLLQVKKIPHNIFKIRFTKKQKEKMSEDPSGSTFDVTLLYLCIKNACDGIAPSQSDLWYTRGDTLEQTLGYLKTFRNNLCHDKISLEQREFMHETESLRDNLEKCLRLAGEKYSIERSEIERIVCEINNDISRFRDAPIAAFNIQSYDNQPLFQEQLNLLLRFGKEEIAEGYNKFCDFNPVSFMTGKEFSLNVGTVFTQIEVVNDMKTPSNETECQTIEYEKLLAFHCKTENGLNKIRLIEGPAGSGKSTLTRKMIADWVSGNGTMETLLSFDFLLYMECRDMANDSFHDLLTSLMPKTSRRFRENDMVKCILALKLLIVIDGIDEMNKSSHRLFKEILDLKKNHDISLFCTTRPEKIEDCFKMIASGEETTYLKITGIPLNRREEFASKYHEELRRIGQSQQETRGLVSYLKTTQRHLQDHLRLPLNLVLLTILWSIAPEKINCVTTATELYYEIHMQTVEKLLLRLKSKEITQHLSVHDLQCKVESFVVKLCKQALVGLKNDEIMLSDESISSLTNISDDRVRALHEESLGAFLVHKIMWTLTGLRYKINYPHKGIQEFLGALFILFKLKEKGVQLDIKCLIKSDLHQILSEFGSLSTLNDNATPCQRCCSTILQNQFQRVCRTFNEVFKGWSDESVFHSGRTPLIRRLRNNLNSSLMDLLNGPTSSTVIMDILQDLYEDEEQIDYYKFKNTFVHLTGLLHLTSRTNISRPLIEELVKILQKTGIKKREEWLDLISNVKCADIVADVIAERIPSIITDNITIKDSRVYSYLSLFKKKCPDSLKVDITATPGDIPLLENLLCLLSEHLCEVTTLEFHDEFQYPSHISSSMDWAVKQIFQDCEVTSYRGAISQRFPGSIPSSLQRLRTGIARAEEYEVLKRLLAPTPTSIPPVKRLVIHLSNGIDYDKLTPLPGGLNLHIYLSDIDSSRVEWACKTLKAIQPERRGFTSIMFPRCKLDVTDFENLLNGLVAADVPVLSTICTSANIPFDQVQGLHSLAKARLRTEFRLVSDQDIWTKW
ncbi:uncharacterized protein [Palaemon carinicauda]|uniref:uncharacterized protein n=1 Tax=Palaemon carinicauda TaxID=392227 RepID=UPI0035B61FCB